MKRTNAAKIAAALLAGLILAGCTSYSQPRYGGEGVYYDRAYHPPAARVHVNPVYYPYWSLDYFYFSRHYHPYSVVIHRHDPWFYPYPGWYYGYRPGPRSSLAFSYRYYYPWYAWGPHYHYYRPWQSSAYFSYWRYSSPRHHHYSPQDRVRQEDLRLREMQRRQAMTEPAHRRGPTPAVAPRIPASSRQHPVSVRERRDQTRSGPVIRDHGPVSDQRSRHDPAIQRQRIQPEPHIPPPPRSRSPRREEQSSPPPRPQSGAIPQRAPSEPRPRSRSSSRETSPAPPRSTRSGSRSRSSSSPPPSRTTTPRRSESAPTRSSRSSNRRDRDR